MSSDGDRRCWSGRRRATVRARPSNSITAKRLGLDASSIQNNLATSGVDTIGANVTGGGDFVIGTCGYSDLVRSCLDANVTGFFKLIFDGTAPRSAHQA